MYKVIVRFADLEDGKHLYHAGDKFPRDGVNVSDKRLAELSGPNNKLGKPLIEKVIEKAAPTETTEIPVEETETEKPVEHKPKKGKKKNDAD